MEAVPELSDPSLTVSLSSQQEGSALHDPARAGPVRMQAGQFLVLIPRPPPSRCNQPRLGYPLLQKAVGNHGASLDQQVAWPLWLFPEHHQGKGWSIEASSHFACF